MGPLSFLYGAPMLFPACFKAAGRLTDVYLIALVACVLIYTLLFLRVSLSFVFIAKYIG